MQKIRVFETFAGIGSQHKALEILKRNNILDYEIAGTSEWDIWANISYNSIHHDNKNIALQIDEREIDHFLLQYDHSFDSKKLADISRIKNLDLGVKQLLYSAYKNSKNQGSIIKIDGKKLIENIEEFDLLTYSFPCQDLSVAGSFHGFNQGMKKGSGTRSGLLWEIERILNELSNIGKLPRFLLLENVKNMISSRHKDDYIEWLKFLNSKGYNTQTYLLNAIDYGIPQTRVRVYALSILNGDRYQFNDTYNASNQTKIIENNLPTDLSKIFKINKIILDIINNNVNKIDEIIEAIPNRTPSRLKMFRKNPLLFTKNEKEVKKRKKYIFSLKDDIFYLQTVRTITTKQDRHPNAGIIDVKDLELNLKNKAKYRFLTTNEAYQLMGFEEKDYYKVRQVEEITKHTLYRQAGNSIVVNVLVAIFYLLKEMK